MFRTVAMAAKCLAPLSMFVCSFAENYTLEGKPAALTIRDNWDSATRIARAWQQDASIVEVYATNVNGDGTVDVHDPSDSDNRIVYRFFSPSKFTVSGNQRESRMVVVIGANHIETCMETQYFTGCSEEGMIGDAVRKAALSNQPVTTAVQVATLLRGTNPLVKPSDPLLKLQVFQANKCLVGHTVDGEGIPIDVWAFPNQAMPARVVDLDKVCAAAASAGAKMPLTACFLEHVDTDS